MFTVREYKQGLNLIRHKISESQYAILRTQYYAPNKTITSSQLAKAIGYSNFSIVNMQYGKLGHLIAASLNRLPTTRTEDGTYQWWKVLSSGTSSKSGFRWTMHSKLAQALEELEIVTPNKMIFLEEIANPETLIEGAVHRITIDAYERNAKARSICIEYYGTCCVICSFNFEKTYGEVGIGYIHIHHLRALSEIREKYEINPIKDLRPVCPNCHAIVHQRVPAYSIEEVQAMLLSAKA
jgi:putative restriction endonuclease